jgi:hypothetical protein
MDHARVEQHIDQGSFYEDTEYADAEPALVVFVPGYRLEPRDFSTFLTSLMQEDFLGVCDLLPYQYNNGRFSNETPEAIACALSEEIESRYHGRHYRAIYLIGHSIGALLIRRAILIGHEQNADWPSAVQRLILMAGTNRGYVPARPTDKFGAALIAFFGLPLCKLIMSCLRGASWVTSLRMEWLRLFHSLGKLKQPPTIQFYGSMDRVVAIDDASEINRFDNARFVVLEGITHEGFTSIHGANNPHYQRIRAALVEELDTCPKPHLEKRDHLVFLIHGICDFAEWQDALEFEIETIQKNVAVIQVQYGYFNILQFLLPHQQKRAVRVFVDRYVQEVSKSPQATISIAAHSNGTLVFERAVRENTFLKVDRAYLAGSILPSTIRWSEAPYCEQVKLVRNVTATRDWPVGILCNALKWIYRSFGTAGYHGFTNTQLNYGLEGPHGVALQPHHRAKVAKYLVGEDVKIEHPNVKPSRAMNFLSKTSVFWLIAVIVSIGYTYRLIALSTWPVSMIVFLSALFTLFIIWLLQRI